MRLKDGSGAAQWPEFRASNTFSSVFMGASKREKRRKYGRETLEMQPRLIMSHQQPVAMTTDFINRPMRGQRQDEFTIESFLFTLCLSLSTIFVVLGAHSSQLNSGTLGTIYEIYKLNELSDTRKRLSVFTGWPRCNYIWVTSKLFHRQILPTSHGTTLNFDSK